MTLIEFQTSMNEDIERRIVLLGSSLFILCQKKQIRPTNKLLKKIENHNFFVFKMMVSSKKICPIPQDNQLTIWLKSAPVQVPAVPIFDRSFVILCHNLCTT